MNAQLAGSIAAARRRLSGGPAMNAQLTGSIAAAYPEALR